MIEYEDGGTYNGEISDGTPNGWGVLETKNQTFEGECFHGKIHVLTETSMIKD